MSSSVWNPDNVRDVAESVGIASLADNVVEELARDVDYRLAQVLEEALKFMRHGKRTTLSTHDISHALKVLNVEPLYGYESARPLRFGEASLGPGQPLYYLEDEEVDFEKLINAPLPKVPREITFTAHWLAVEGVQPSIPQNPTASNQADLLPKGPNANPHLAAANGLETSVKPLVKHVLSKESQELFAKLSSALLDESNPEWQNAALSSIQSDPGIHQLTTYLITFIAEKVTHSMKNLFVLKSMLKAIDALLANPTIYLDPYIPYMVPPVLTCCVGKHLGPALSQAPSNASSETLNGNNVMNGQAHASPEHFEVRKVSASLLQLICRKYSSSNQGLKTRIARSCLKAFLDPNKPLGTHYGALQALRRVLGADGIRIGILPNLKIYDEVLKEAFADDSKKGEAQHVLAIILSCLDDMERSKGAMRANGVANLEGQRERLTDKVGEVVADQIIKSGRTAVAQAVLEADLNIV
ncbi:TAF-domain-containing protein [Bimuria novae-zelandiae CBS 107.79]|uniref:TBP-associated factor 6 n=1 Tax=Bimuria novae-zelandiae CBS 107.79 TaxID=1447943 RepID=A0A6A5V0M1_9PLEO|nr:TAF-domain-containing protein [Bimuria novae-zelandiae CBS 107.79]